MIYYIWSLFWFYEYCHVGYTMHNKEYHLELDNVRGRRGGGGRCLLGRF